MIPTTFLPLESNTFFTFLRRKKLCSFICHSNSENKKISPLENSQTPTDRVCEDIKPTKNDHILGKDIWAFYCCCDLAHYTLKPGILQFASLYKIFCYYYSIRKNIPIEDIKISIIQSKYNNYQKLEGFLSLDIKKGITTNQFINLIKIYQLPLHCRFFNQNDLEGNYFICSPVFISSDLIRFSEEDGTFSVWTFTDSIKRECYLGLIKAFKLPIHFSTLNLSNFSLVDLEEVLDNIKDLMLSINVEKNQYRNVFIQFISLFSRPTKKSFTTLYSSNLASKIKKKESRKKKDDLTPLRITKIEKTPAIKTITNKNPKELRKAPTLIEAVITKTAFPSFEKISIKDFR